jgi:YD repeat-containing protein
MSKIKLLIILSGIIMTIAGFSITAGAISYEYDDLGRLIEVIYDSGQKIVYTYDAGGNILSVKDVTPVKLNPIGIYFEQYTNFFERPHLYKPQEDGESFEELLVRVRNAWDEIIKAGGNNVLIVTHAVVLKTI